MMSLEHFPGAIPEARPWPGRGAVKGVSPGGVPFARPARLPEGRGRGLDTPKGHPGGVLWTLDGGVPASAYTLGRDGSGLRAPVIRCRLLMLGLGVGKREKREER